MGRITKVLVWQFVITIAIGSMLYVWFGPKLGLEHAQAALFGGAAALLMSILLKIVIESLNARLARKENANKNLLLLLFIPRLILLMAFFAYGIGVLHLEPISMVATFAVAYMVYWMDWKFSSEEKIGQA